MRRLRLFVYTYIHLLIVAGIIVSAVADELVLMHLEHVEPAGIVAIIGGPALYLLGNALFKWSTNDRRAPPFSHCVGLALLAVLTPVAFAKLVSPLVLRDATTAIVVIVGNVGIRGPAPAGARG